MHLPPPDTGELLCNPVSFRQSVDTLKRQLYERADQLYEKKLQVVSAAVTLRQREVSRWEKDMLALQKNSDTTEVRKPRRVLFLCARASTGSPS